MLKRWGLMGKYSKIFSVAADVYEVGEVVYREQ